MVKFADGPPSGEGMDMAGGLAALPKTKSFASKSLGESEKSGIQVTLYQLRYKVPNMVNKKEWKYLLGGLEPLSGTLDPGNMIALVTQPGSTLTANCAPIWDDFASGALQDAITFTPEDIARNFLSRYPLGDGYDAKRKFTEFSKWECLGYLLLIFFAFLVLYWQTCKLSIKLVKR